MITLFMILAGIPAQGARELLIPPTPTTALFREALVASSLPSAFLINPALAVKEPYTTVFLSHSEWFAGTRVENVNVLLPFSWGTLGVGARGFHLWEMEHRDNPDDVPEPFYAYNTGIQVRYARSFGNLALGAEAEAFLQHIYSYTAPGITLGVGASYYLKPVSIGLSFSDIGPAVRLLGEAAALPSRGQIGLCWEIIPGFRALAGTSVAFDGSWNASAGISGKLFEVLRLEAAGGYGGHPHAGAGAGIEFKYVRINYATSLRFGIGFTHHVGIDAIIPPSQEEDPIVRNMRETSQRFVEIGNRDMYNQDYRHAIDQYDLALVWWPDNAEAQQGYEDALAAEQQRQISLHLEAARHHADIGDYLDALREYEYVLSLDANNDFALAGKADMLLMVREMPILTQADVTAELEELFEGGVAAFRLEDYKQALAYWQEIEARYPYLEEIQPFLTLAGERRDEQVDSLLRAAYNARERDALRQAITLTEKVLEIDPTESRAHNLR
jgi:Tfp pilus assembly protein PilF